MQTKSYSLWSANMHNSHGIRMRMRMRKMQSETVIIKISKQYWDWAHVCKWKLIERVTDVIGSRISYTCMLYVVWNFNEIECCIKRHLCIFSCIFICICSCVCDTVVSISSVAKNFPVLNCKNEYVVLLFILWQWSIDPILWIKLL